MSLLTLLCLALVQGLTEFLPISSSGHLVLARELLGVKVAEPLVLDVALHAGTLLAVIAVYRRDLWSVASAIPGLWSAWRAKRPFDEDQRLLLALAVATLPALVVGLSAKDWIEAQASAARPVSFALLGSAAWLIFAGRRGGGERAELSWREAFLVGLAQAVALLPGCSRSGWTIGAGLLLGLRAERAARFSFLLSLPAVGGAVVLEGRHLLDGSASIGLGPFELFLGVAVSAVTGLLAWKGLLLVLRRGSLAWFGAYCALAGALGLLLAGRG